MYESLTKISSLPEDIKVYCAHEYTMNNIEFALVEDKNNKALLQRKEKLKNIKVTLPSTIKEELETNPFLRVRNELAFKKLRIKKDAY
jgi:hydroxyacylglutathione hydrolase